MKRITVVCDGCGASGSSALTADLIGYKDIFSFGFETGIFRNSGGIYELYSTIESHDCFIFHEQFSRFCAQVTAMEEMIRASVADTYKVTTKCENINAASEFLTCFEGFKSKCVQNEFFWPFHVYGNEYIDAYEPLIKHVPDGSFGSFVTEQCIKIFKPKFAIDRSKPQKAFMKKANINKEEFLILAKDFLSEVMDIMSERKVFAWLHLITSNRISCFEEQSQFFDDLRMIFVMRDPRDIFTGWTRRNWLKDDQADIFVDTFKYLTVDYPHNHRKILDIRFEDFVLNHDETSKKILNFIEVSPESYDAKSAVYNVQDSVKNIGRWKQYPNQEVMKYIASELKDYLYES